MTAFLSYLFWPNPGNATYSSPKALVLILLCAVLVLCAIAFRVWRARSADAVLKKLSRSWSAAALWFGLIGIVLVVARVEQIQFIAMRFLWILWGIAFAAYLVLQVRAYRSRYYQVLPTQTSQDPRRKYLPKRKKR